MFITVKDTFDTCLSQLKTRLLHVYHSKGHV